METTNTTNTLSIFNNTSSCGKHIRFIEEEEPTPPQPPQTQTTQPHAQTTQAQFIPFIANGNITSRDDAQTALTHAHPVVGVMSAEGILRDPAIFLQAFNRDRDELNGVKNLTCIPDRNHLFQEYCDLSELYEQAGGWTACHIADPSQNNANLTGSAECETVVHPQHRQQIYVARQHLTWMLGKTGHGRCVRYEHLGECYKKHTQLLAALNEAATIQNN
jgi:tRNA-dihydrouridine synthase